MNKPVVLQPQAFAFRGSRRPLSIFCYRLLCCYESFLALRPTTGGSHSPTAGMLIVFLSPQRAIEVYTERERELKGGIPYLQDMECLISFNNQIILLLINRIGFMKPDKRFFAAKPAQCFSSFEFGWRSG